VKGMVSPVCAKCGREMVCWRNGVVVWHPTEPVKGDPMDDIDFVVIGDKYRCPDCGSEVVVDFSSLLMTPPFKQNLLREIVEKAKEKVQIRRT